MKTLIINPHSFVDIITNSSTVIYTYVNSIQAVKDVMNAVIAGLPNVTVTADDLFDFREVMSNGAYDRYIDNVLDDEEHEHFEALSKINNDKNLEWSTRYNLMRDFLKTDGVTSEEVSKLCSSGWNDYYPETRLEVIPKFEGGRDDIGELLMRVFSHEAEYDG